MKHIATVCGAGILALAIGALGQNPKVYRGEISDSQCALNVHSLTRSHQEMLKSKSMGGTSASCTQYCIKYLGGEYVLSSKNEVTVSIMPAPYRVLPVRK